MERCPVLRFFAVEERSLRFFGRWKLRQNDMNRNDSPTKHYRLRRDCCDMIHILARSVDVWSNTFWQA